MLACSYNNNNCYNNKKNLKNHKRFFKTSWYIYGNNKQKIPNYFLKVYYLEQQKNVDPCFSPEGILNSLPEFKYVLDNRITLPAYFCRYETIFMKRCEQWSDKEKITLLLQKFGTEENTKYTNLILPKKKQRKSRSRRQQRFCQEFSMRETVCSILYRSV